jgi:nucleoside-diphosphate-sugar epimerase
MKIAVTGALGYVGSALCRRLSERGEQVCALVRPGGDAAALAAQSTLSALGVELREADLADPNTLAEGAEGCDAMVHCAGESVRHAPPAVLSWLNVAGTENALAGARHAGVRRFVHLSCADVSLVNRDRVHWKEDAVLGQAPLGAYARNKLLAEELALQKSDARMSVVAIRPAYLWGPGEHTNLPELCRQARQGGVRLCGGGQNLLSAAYIDNVVSVLVAAARSDRVTGQALHVADPDFLNAGEFFGQLCKALGLPPPKSGLYALEYALAFVRQRRRAPGMWCDDVARVGRGGLLDCLRALTLLEPEPAVSVERGMATVASWAQTAGGPKAIEALARKPAGPEEVARCERLAAGAGNG